jgi:hypothetical protein
MDHSEYRVIHCEDDFGPSWYEIRLVFFDAEGHIDRWKDNPEEMVWGRYENSHDLIEIIRAATSKKTLEFYWDDGKLLLRESNGN